MPDASEYYRAVKIECYMSLRCSSEEPLKENIETALALEGMKAEVTFRRIEDEEAAMLGLKGSPSVFINGKNIDPQEMSGFA